MRRAAIGVVLAAVAAMGAGCGGDHLIGSTGDADARSDAADAGAEARDASFVDVPGLDGALPCDDQHLVRMRIGGDIEPSPQRYVFGAAADGNGLVLVWGDQNPDCCTTHAGRIRDPFAPVLERLAEPLPRPAVSVLLPVAGGVRFVFSDAPRGGPPTAWADLGHDNAFGPLVDFGAPPSGVAHVGLGCGCQGESAAPMAAFAVSDADGNGGLSVAVFEGSDVRFLPAVFASGVPEAHVLLQAVQCVVDGGTITVLGQTDWNQPMLMRWSAADGTVLGPPVTLPGGPASTLLTVDTAGLVVFGINGSTDGSSAPLARAFRLAGEVAEQVATTALGPLPGAGWWPVPIGVFPSGAGLLLLYNYDDILFLLPFSAAAGFSPDVLLTDAGCRAAPQDMVATSEGTFLPCAEAGPLFEEEGRIFMIGMCRNGGH